MASTMVTATIVASIGFMFSRGGHIRLFNIIRGLMTPRNLIGAPVVATLVHEQNANGLINQNNPIIPQFNRWGLPTDALSGLTLIQGIHWLFSGRRNGR